MASTVVVSPAWTLQSQDTATVGRLHDAAFLPSINAAPNTQVRPGVIPTVGTGANAVPIDLFVAQSNTPAMSVQVFPGNFVVSNSTRGLPYVGGLSGATGNITLTVATANATNPRIDLVYAQVIDTVATDTGTSSSVIGIVTGTASGSPAVPPLPTNGVCIPLAQVAVAANATTIVSANITDVRKSSGPSPRFLLGGDALSDPGFRYGELRQRLLSTYTTGQTGAVSSLLTEYWGFDSRWHGMNRFNIPQPTQTGSGTLAAGALAVIGTFTIPDPGFPYHIRAGGSVGWTSFATAGIGDRGLFLFAQVDSSAANTNIITQGFAGNYTTLTTTQYATETPGAGNSSKLVAAGYTGSHVVNLTASCIGQQVVIDTGLLYQFDIEIVAA